MSQPEAIPVGPIPGTEPEEVEQEEVITGTLENDGEDDRKVRVYAGNGEDDFILTLPPGCRMTFGYFNPGTDGTDRYGNPRNTADSRKTALRVYKGSGNGSQLAAFLGVKGFRDETVKLQKLVERVTIERRVVDDGEGTVEYDGKNKRELRAIQENSEF